jgi:hypothetical protein
MGKSEFLLRSLLVALTSQCIHAQLSKIASKLNARPAACKCNIIATYAFTCDKNKLPLLPPLLPKPGIIRLTATSTATLTLTARLTVLLDQAHYVD